MYQGATSGGECPLVVDTSTPSCGTSRFGCWVCTLVDQDRSMEAMIANDEEKVWMTPLVGTAERTGRAQRSRAARLSPHRRAGAVVPRQHGGRALQARVAGALAAAGSGGPGAGPPPGAAGGAERWS